MVQPLAEWKERVGAVGFDLIAHLGDARQQLKEGQKTDAMEGVRIALDEARDELQAVDVDGLQGHPRERQVKDFFRELVGPYLYSSWLFDRGYRKPRGYPGDYELLETMYSDMERSHGVGGLLDRYFLDDALCRGVIRRSAHLRELLTRRLLEGQQRVLNLACGPCFEVREVAMQPELHSSQVVGVDFDQDALDFTASKLNGSRRVSWEGRRENLLRLALRGWTIQEREAFDFTYSIGLFDYLEDRALSSVLRFMREQTSTEGVVVTSFKDCDQYSPTAYDWFCDWQFVPRRLEDAKRMLCEAGIATADMHIESLDGDEIFFITFPGCRVPGSRGGHGGRARESSESGF